tara:strand:- start:576 stop:2111 length:1536 start_codon:yes stop_codon:yes gene_type:complete
MKNIKFQKIILKKINYFNQYLIGYFNKISNFKKYINKKNKQISNFNKYLIFLICSLFLYLFYLSIPSLYNKDDLQKSLTNKLADEFKINISISSDISYSILPAPNILVKNVKIYNNDLKNPKELSQIKKLKIFISQKKLYEPKYLKINKILIQDANFLIQEKDLEYFNNFINNKFSNKKIVIKKSNFFFKNKNDETISIFPISKLNLFYNEKKLINEITSNGKIFKFPFKLKWSKNFQNKIEFITLLNIKKLKLNMKNESSYENGIYIAQNNVTIRNSKFFSNYKIKNNLISFDSENSRLLNSSLDYQGKIFLKPFDLMIDLNLDKINLKSFFNSDQNFKEIFKLESLYNTNFSARIILNVKKIINNKLFQNSKIFINFNNGKINFDNSFLQNEKIGKLNLYNSSIAIIDEQLIFKGSFGFKINDKKEFFRVFQIPKKFRKNLENIFFDIEINMFTNKLKIKNFKINHLKAATDQNIQLILNEYNAFESNRIKNWVSLKNFVNRIFESYLG